MGVTNVSSPRMGGNFEGTRRQGLLAGWSCRYLVEQKESRTDDEVQWLVHV